MGIFKLIRAFQKANGRSPSPSELDKLKQQADIMSKQENVIPFPQGGKDRRSPFDDFKASEDAYEELIKKEITPELVESAAKEIKNKKRIKGARPGNINYEAMQEKFPDVKLYGDESFDELLDIEKTGKHPRDKADGGRAGFKVGGILDLLNLIKRKVGKKNITTADKIKRPQSALDREMFKEFNERNRKLTKDEIENFENEMGDGLEAYDFDGTAGDAERILKEDEAYKAEMFAEYQAEGGAKRAGGPKDPIKKAMDEVGGNFTGDLKYDANVLADELAFQRGLIPEGGDLTDIVDQNKRMDLYDEAYSAVSGVFKQQREMKKLSKPTKTLKNIEDTGTIDISDPTIADEFDTFLRENDPEGYKNLEQKIQLDTFDPKGRKKNAVGGLAYMLGEEPRSEYSAGGGTGAPAVTYGEGINIPGSPKGIPTGQIGPVNIGVYGGGGYSKNQEVPGVNRATTNQDLGITAEMPIGDSGFSVGGNYMKSRTNERFTGDLIPGQTFKNVPIDSDRFNVGINFKKQFADGGRIGFKKGGMDRRSFLKLMGGLASIPILGRFIKPVAKVAETAAPVVAEGVKLGYDKFLMLVDKIKKLGRKTNAVTQKEREVGYVYKGKDGNEYELVEDITTGDVRVTKDKPGGMTIGDESFDTIEDRSTFVLKRNQADETTKGKKPPDEYDEMKEIPGPDGTFDDIDEVSDISVKEILEELGETKIKKAGGGLAHMLGE